MPMRQGLEGQDLPAEAGQPEDPDQDPNRGLNVEAVQNDAALTPPRTAGPDVEPVQGVEGNRVGPLAAQVGDAGEQGHVGPTDSGIRDPRLESVHRSTLRRHGCLIQGRHEDQGSVVVGGK